MNLFLLLTLSSLCLSMHAQINKPFPQHTSYQAGVIKPNHVSQQQVDKSVRDFYIEWKNRYIKKGCNANEYYVWSEGVKNYVSVSEGQGYGMVIIVYMAGIDPMSQKIYDGLFNYCRTHPSKRSPYLMAWQQLLNCRDAEKSSATDGDMDIAYSLILADAQWGSKGNINYLAEASAMIHEIMQQEINSKTYSVLLSNAVEHDSKDYFDMRSSDFMPAYFKAYGHISNDSSWLKVVDKNYKLFDLFQRKFSPDAGLLPDFILHINNHAIPARGKYLESKYDGYYNYNACRIPWRIGSDYILNGDNRSKQIVEKINSWIRETTKNVPDNLSAGYTLAGDDIHGRFFEALSFIAPFAVSAMVDSKNQVWLNKLWDYIIDFKMKDFDYYDNTVKMICLIIVSGNYW